MNFNAAIGDKWLRLPIVTSWPCNSRRAHVVLDTGHIVINGFSLRTVVNQYTNSIKSGSSTFTIAIRDTIIERVVLCTTGAEGSDMLPLYCEGDDIVAEYWKPVFKCYSDSLFPPHNGKKEGCSLITGLQNTAPEKRLSVYPNPVQNVLLVNMEGSTEETVRIDMINSYGQTILQRNHGSGYGLVEIPVADLVAGLYFLKIHYSNGQEMTQRFVRE